jgi:thiamine biosynthesis protein ThiI
MKEIILIKNGELALKGLNRMTFEDILIKNIKQALRPYGSVEIKRAQSTIIITPKEEDFPFRKALESVDKVFGIAAYCRAAVCEKDMDQIIKTAIPYLEESLKKAKTFKVEAKRSDKNFPLTSPEISKTLGGEILKNYHHLKVDVHSPDVIVTVEVRDFGAYVRAGQLHGAGGMPVGTGGRASILISGGIDSPVAAWMMAKRGIKLNAIHFASPPYTSARAEQKVKKLLSKVAKYSGAIPMGIVPFTEIQEAIANNCPEEYFTLIMRRMMMRISEKLARKSGSMALITGESVGQVASQTLPALVTTDSVVNMPVFRPLIGMDKEEIIVISRKIDTFETSIEPYEDCCTVFTPRHPRTNPKLEAVEKAEQCFDFEEMIERAVEGTVFETIE